MSSDARSSTRPRRSARGSSTDAVWHDGRCSWIGADGGTATQPSALGVPRARADASTTARRASASSSPSSPRSPARRTLRRTAVGALRHAARARAAAAAERDGLHAGSLGIALGRRPRRPRCSARRSCAAARARGADATRAALRTPLPRRRRRRRRRGRALLALAERSTTARTAARRRRGEALLGARPVTPPRLVVGRPGRRSRTTSAGSRTARPGSAGRCASCSPRPATSGSAPAPAARSPTSGRGSTGVGNVAGPAAPRAAPGQAASGGRRTHRHVVPRRGRDRAVALRAVALLGDDARDATPTLRSDDAPPRRGAAARDRGPLAVPRRGRRGRRAAVRRASATRRWRSGTLALERYADGRRLAVRRAGGHDARPVPRAQRDRLVAAPAARSSGSRPRVGTWG